MRNKTAIIVAVLASLTCLPCGGCASRQGESFARRELPVIELPGDTMVILEDARGFESPALSADGNRVVLQVETYRDPVLPYEVCSIGVSERGASGEWSKLRIVHEGVYHKYWGRMELPVQPSFDETGESVFVTRIFFHSALSIPWLGTVRSWVDRIPLRGGQTTRCLTHGDWQLKRTELLQHARCSPDKRWLAFYTREHKADQGIYLLDRTTGQHIRLSHERDKHPTWSPDGGRLYFHTVTGGRRRRFEPFVTSVERSILGFYEMETDGNGAITWRRRLMDTMGEAYVYDKHPVEVPGTGLLFLHGRLKPGGKLKLMVRAAEPGSPVFVIRPTWQGKRIKAAKHACASRQSSELMFVAKPKGEKRYRLLMGLDARTIESIRRRVIGYERNAVTEAAP